jgi:hypothetical protein
MAVREVVVTEKLHGSSFRAGFHGSRQLMYGTHTSRVLDERVSSTTWPNGHLVQKMLLWSEAVDLPSRIARYRAAHPDVTSCAIYGEIYGFKCSDLHYGMAGSEVRLFGDVTVNGKWLSYDDALAVIAELFPDVALTDLLVPVLYRGKPDLAVFKILRDRPSTRAGQAGKHQVSEGVVIRPTTEVFSETAKDRLIAKYKSPLYEERKSLREADATVLPTYVTAYDLLTDFITEERVKHVLQQAVASGMTIEKRNIPQFGSMLFADILKESVGEWPPGSELLDQRLLARWTNALSGEMLATAVETWVA